MSGNISFMIVISPRLSNEPKSWNHIKLYVSDNDFKSCRKITTYSDLLFNDEYEEFIKRMSCKIITSEEFKNQYWEDNFTTKRRGHFKRYDCMDEQLRDAIDKCKKCIKRRCYDGSCETYKYLSSRND